MVARRTLTRATFVTLTVTLTAATTLTGPSAAAWQPGSVADQIAEADAALREAQVRLAETYEAFAVAEQRYQELNAAVTAAQNNVAVTQAEAEAASGREQNARVEIDEFTSASYRHGSDMFSARAYIGASSPSDLLDRASLVTALASEYGDVMDSAQGAVEDKTAADRDARVALGEVEKNREAASGAKTTAEQAYNAAVAVEGEAASEVSSLVNRKTTLTTTQGSEAVVNASGPVVRPAVGRLTSTYGPRGGTIHFGIDIANTIGTPILSAMAGEVIDSGPASGFGLWVRVQHADGLVTVYGHINETLVSVGQQVAAGEQIATLGNRGESTGPHLHFEVHADGSKIDPLPWLRSNGVSI